MAATALVCRTVSGRYLWITVLAILLGPHSPGFAQSPGSAPPGLLTTIKAIRTLSQDDGDRGYRVRVRGTVTHFDEQADTGLILHDGEVGQYVLNPPDAASMPAWTDLQLGDAIEIEGRTVRGGFAPNVVPTAVRRLGQAALPTPERIAFAAMQTGRHDCDYVEVVGVVLRTWRSPDPTQGTLFADVAFEEGVLRATFWQHAPADAQRFIDARVRLRGNVGTLFGPTEQLRGVSLFVGRTSDIEVLESPPDPFTIPARSIRSIYNYSAAGEVNRRIRIRGVVTGYVPGHPVEISDFTSTSRFRFVRHVLYVDDGTGGARIETEQSQGVDPGIVVDVVGFPAVTPGKPILTNAIFRAAETAAQPSAVVVSGANVLTPDHDATLVRMEGHFLSALRNPRERVLVMRAGETVFDASLDASAAADELERIRPGSLVSVTGVYAYRWGPPPTFHLYLRSADDVAIVSEAPWWTLQHTAVMLVMLALVAGSAGVWVRTSADRKRQEYQLILNERSRVGRELHDTLEQGLAGIALQLEAVAGSLENSPEAARRSLDVARQMLRYSEEEARRSVADLRSQALESRDLAGALTAMVRQMTLGTSVQAEVRVEGATQRLDASQEHHLLRIGLEAVTNALKHSGARRIAITLHFRGFATDLAVEDDGCGLGHGVDVPDDRFGLQGIRERVDKLGGVLQIDSEPGAGTRLAVSVPIGPSRASDINSASDVNRTRLDESWRTN
jgi:signal transduction histidine kinase